MPENAPEMMDNAPDTGTPEGGDGQSGEQGQSAGHHSQRQPRDDAQRFAKDGKPPAPARLRRTVKRNGKDVEEEADEAELWGARDQVARIQHMERASTQRFQRASELVKDAETAKQVAQAIASKDFSTLRGYFEKNKLNPKEALADLLDAAIQDEEMTPEQRELVQLRAEKAASVEQQRRQKEDAEVETFYKEVDALRPQVEEVWKHALEKTTLPKTAKMMEITSRIYLEAAEAGTQLSPEQVAEFARWELVDVNGPLVNELEPMQLVQHFGPLSKKIDESMAPEDFEKAWPNLAKRYHRLLVARLKGGGTTRGAAPPPRPRPTTGKQGGDQRPLLDPLVGM
jgi:hypothetical protein